MKSGYKIFGEYIEQVSKRNTGLAVEDLRGINISKEFMPSVANVTGTDLSKYRVVSRNEFAYNPMHVGRDEVLPISLLLENKSIIVSPAYTVFRIKPSKKEELLEEYLMMWCRRSEFDRNVWFTTDSSVRGGLSWQDFCSLELPVPSIEKQQEIVDEYNTIVNRIKLNEQLNQKLEETAQTIYKQWFEEFEFPISKEYAQKINKPELEGKPYKSSGGEFVYNDELDIKIPVGWGITDYMSSLNFKTGKLNSNAAVIDGDYPFFTCSSDTFKTNTYSFDCEAVILAGNNASAVYPLKFFRGKFDAYQRTYVITSNNNMINNEQIYFSIKDELAGFKGTSSGTATKFLTIKLLNDIKIIEALEQDAKAFKMHAKPFLDLLLLSVQESEKLDVLKNVVLAKMTKVGE